MVERREFTCTAEAPWVEGSSNDVGRIIHPDASEIGFDKFRAKILASFSPQEKVMPHESIDIKAQFRATNMQRTSDEHPAGMLQDQLVRWWAHKDSNLGPAD